MKNEKHVALAQRIIDRKEEWTNTEWGNDCRWEVIDDDYLKKIICEEVEYEALASKVVFPSEDEVMEAEGIDWDDPLGVYYYLRSQLTLAPNEPEVKAQGFEEIVWHLIDQVDESAPNWDEHHAEIVSELRKAFLAGQNSKAATLKLPERRIDNPENMQWTAMETQGWNDCLDAVKSMNEGSGDGT